MKAILTSKTYCIPLTIAQWEVLRIKEDYHDENHYKSINSDKSSKTPGYTILSKTWLFPECDKIDEWEWNGHFGRNIFFRIEAPGDTVHVLRFLEKYLTPNVYFHQGLIDGENGRDENVPSKRSKLNQLFYIKGHEMGMRFGSKFSLQKFDVDLEK